jgi:hypothetical protein
MIVIVQLLSPELVGWSAPNSTRPRGADIVMESISLVDTISVQVTSDGVPGDWPAARRSFIDVVRHRQVAEAGEPTLALLREESQNMILTVREEKQKKTLQAI